jgi:hypothetical protein
MKGEQRFIPSIDNGELIVDNEWLLNISGRKRKPPQKAIGKAS